VIGQFIRIALTSGKTRYLGYLPRVAGYLGHGLNEPVLAPLRKWFAMQGIDFARFSQPDLSQAKKLVRPNAF
jgi:aminoglycoside/choline kinase family phosphotransferase